MSGAIVTLLEQVAQWCINRAAHGDVNTDVLVDNFAAQVKKIIAVKQAEQRH